MNCINFVMERDKIMTKNYSLRITVLVKADNDQDAERLAKIYVKELPRMNDTSVHKASVFNLTEKRETVSDLH